MASSSSTSTLGSYRLIAEIGHGGMADVYLAAAEGPAGSGFTKLTVVKKLRSHLAEDPEFVAMLMDEARLTARLTHPNVVQLFEVGESEGQYFLAMEYLEGQPLHRVERRIERHARHTGTSIDRSVYYAAVSDVLAGLHYAHELADYDGTPLAVVHRDVTPHNVFVTYDGAVKVVDFGIAKAAGRSTETRQGIIKGKIRYMSPEQAGGGVIDRRTDIFAAGVMLWNFAAGVKLWADRTDVDVARALYAGDYPLSPRSANPDVPEAIDAICRKALAPRREDRYATAAEMRADLEAFLGQGSADARARTASMMKSLFEAERAKVRAVLDASRLTSDTSIDELAAAMNMGLRARVAPPDLGSVSAMAVPAGPSERAVTNDVVGTLKSRAHDEAPPAASRRVRRGVALGMGLAAALAAFVAVSGSGRHLVTDAAPSAVPVSEPAVVLTDRTAPAGVVRTKAEPQGPSAPVTATEARGFGGKAGRAAKATKASRPVPAAPSAEPSSTPRATSTASGAPARDVAPTSRQRAPLDSTDPWRSVPAPRPTD